jgi:hypothetical protein
MSADGRFQKGHPGGPGRPKRSTEENYLRLTIACVPPERWQKIVKKAVTQAERGDRYAREWLRRILLGDDPVQVAALVQDLQAALMRIREYESQHQTTGRAALGDGGESGPAGAAAALDVPDGPD